ncbi:MAG: hypothetical protein V4489_04285, partial [Chlamydiota bacterium]
MRKEPFIYVKVNDGALGSVGIPLGNATSQLFANIYLHELDDFIILSNKKDHLQSLIALIREFLTKNLQLE